MYANCKSQIDFDWAWIWTKKVVKELPRQFLAGAFKRRDFDHFMVLASQQSFVMPPLVNFVQPALTAAMKNVEKIVFEVGLFFPRLFVILLLCSA